MSGDIAPLSVTLAADTLTLEWPDGRSSLAAARLRAACRCAPCQAARLRGETVSTGTGALVDARLVGHYALQLVFADGHDRGIYPWEILRALAAGEEQSAGGSASPRCT